MRHTAGLLEHLVIALQVVAAVIAVVGVLQVEAVVVGEEVEEINNICKGSAQVAFNQINNLIPYHES